MGHLASVTSHDASLATPFSLQMIIAVALSEFRYARQLDGPSRKRDDSTCTITLLVNHDYFKTLQNLLQKLDAVLRFRIWILIRVYWIRFILVSLLDHEIL